MKKLFFFAAAALALASCSSDETTAINLSQNQTDAIGFRPFVNKSTRAAGTYDVTSPGASGTYDLTKFKVTALTHEGTPTTYINGVIYVYDNSTTFYVDGSAAGTNKYKNEYYWPSSKNLDFYAYSYSNGTDFLGTSGQISEDATDGYKTLNVTPDATVSTPNQIDLVFASIQNIGKKDTYNTTSEYGYDGVPLTFRHAESKISVKLENSASKLKFIADAWKICNISNSGKFTYNHGSTGAGEATATLTNAMWDLSAASATTYTSTFTAKTFDGVVTPASDQDGASNSIGSMILIPQNITAASAYADNSTGDGISTGAAISTGQYIAVKLKIIDKATDVTIADDGAGNAIWAIWPLPSVIWQPGKHYTYTIDLAGGGYYERNTTVVVTNDTSLDPILYGAVIKFVSVEVQDWDVQSETSVSGPASF